MKDNEVYLRHILECIRRIEENTASGKEPFFASHTLQDATLRNLQTMAESTQRLSAKVKAAHPEVEWRRLAAFRNVMTYNYLGIDLELTWEVVQTSIPTLKQQSDAMLREVLAEDAG